MVTRNIAKTLLLHAGFLWLISISHLIFSLPFNGLIFSTKDKNIHCPFYEMFVVFLVKSYHFIDLISLTGEIYGVFHTSCEMLLKPDELVPVSLIVILSFIQLTIVKLFLPKRKSRSVVRRNMRTWKFICQSQCPTKHLRNRVQLLYAWR